MKSKSKARFHFITKESGFKKLARGLARRNSNSIANHVVKHAKVCQRVLGLLVKKMQNEMTMLCSKKNNSMLRKSLIEELECFSWDNLSQEVKNIAPTLYTILKGCTNIKRKKRINQQKSSCVSNDVAFGVCVCVLLRHRNIHMNALQRIISLQLNSGHSGKQVTALWM